MIGSFRNKLLLTGLLLAMGLGGWRMKLQVRTRDEVNALRATLAVRDASAQQGPPLATAAPVLPSGARWIQPAPLPSGEHGAFPDNRFTNRLRNTPLSAGQLVHNPDAILLRNAFVDSRSSNSLQIPAELLATNDPGAYIVQNPKGLSRDFNNQIESLGGRIVSYIPNNAYLVIADQAAAGRLSELGGGVSILPYEPYFKLAPDLIGAALVPDASARPIRLVITVPDLSQGIPALTSVGVTEVGRERGPFGSLVTVEATEQHLAPLAQLASVHLIERWHPVRLANDRSGVLLGVNTNADNTGHYLGLTGKGVLVSLNDTGVDAAHPDLAGRIHIPAGATNNHGSNLDTDPDGHGTHVAGILAGDGSQSPTLASTPPQGSITNANYQGKAPKADLFVLPIDLLSGPLQGDAFLQETSAQAPGRTNLAEPLISNNSWGYDGDVLYSTHSASFDAAVRDALPEMTGDQPILFIFAAGNNGNGGDNGLGGNSDSINSPANAKNVITVGALESARNLTNSVIYDTNGAVVVSGSIVFSPLNTNSTDYVTNQVFAGLTDTDYEVASFSSRGNVGIGTEGDSGRFKPDVVAPGAFIISTRSSLWQLTNDIPVTSQELYGVFKDITAETAPSYRYESGTSMAAPAISGLLALMQEFFRQASNGPSPSAAGYKALLINGALPTSDSYNPDPHSGVNVAGWGEPTLPRIIQPGIVLEKASGRSQYILESEDILSPAETPSNSKRVGLATGESKSFALGLSTNGVGSLVRFTLVWTDPPGNPAGASKLVNDLDLVVSNTVTGEVFVGNSFDSQSGLSVAHLTNDFSTNAVAIFDRLNNVERIVLDPKTSTNFVVSVIAHSVNVNARRDEPNAIVQDFALAITSDSFATNALSAGQLTPLTTPIVLNGTGESPIGYVTNGVAFLNERVGANSPLINGQPGQTNQWRFYVFTNTLGATSSLGDLVLTNGSNVAFVTFPVGNLSRVRTNEPDIDLYVSLDASLTNLNPLAIASALKSQSRGASEMILLSNTVPTNAVYYIGVKSEDQQAAEYGFVGLSTDQPFLSNVNGVSYPLAIPLTPWIPDGTPKRPGKGIYMVISTVKQSVRRIVANLTLSHQRFQDLLGNLSHGGHFAVLNNHGRIHGFDSNTNRPGESVTYDDIKGSIRGPAYKTDGPGSLISFLGESGSGPWFMSEIDNASGNTGRISNFQLGFVPNDFGDDFVSRCVDPYSDELEVIQVPPDVTALTVTVTNLTPSVPLEVYIRREELPDPTDPNVNDKFATIQPPGDTISVSTHDVPPLVAGRYFILVHNPNGVQVCYRIRGHLDRSTDGRLTRYFVSSNAPISIPDRAMSLATIPVGEGRPVTGLQVGLRLDHPRESDLAVRLVDPSGTSTLLVENRGLADNSGFGADVVYTNGAFSHVALVYQSAIHQATLYVNGNIVADQTLDGYVPNTTNALYFGLDPAGLIPANAGGLSVDDFGLWGRALFASEVRSVYRQGLQGIGKNPTAGELRALWSFEGTGGDRVGTNAVLFSGTPQFVAGQIGQAVRFPTDAAFGKVLPTAATDVGNLPGFTIDGWIDSSSVRHVIAGWGNSTNSLRPVLLENHSAPLGNGAGSVSALLGYSNSLPLVAPIVLESGGGLNATGVLVTNTLFAVFSEDTNSAFEMIKFATPPYQTDPRAQVVAASSFEKDPAGTYAAGTTLDGWDVDGQVSQVYDSSLAYRGSGFASLEVGGIQRIIPAVIGRYYTVTFAVKRSPTVTNSASQFAFELNGKLVDKIDLLDTWQPYVFHYRATQGSLALHLTPNLDVTDKAGGVWFDDFSVLEELSVHYLAEEPLTPHVGVGSLGNWQLELQDSRGPIVGTLKRWELTLTLAATNPPAARLTNAVSYQTNVVGANTQYFIVEVPPEAIQVTNSLVSITGGPLRLLYNQNGLPDGSLADDQILLDSVQKTEQSRVLDRVLPPIFKPGQRYYLGVQNVNAGDSNSFGIRIDFGIPIVALTNAISYIGTNQNKGGIDFYSFDVAPGVLAAQFSVSNMSGDVNLVLTKAPKLPRKSTFDYASANTGTNREVIALDRSDFPVPVSPGRWYLGVYSSGLPPLVPITYSILATEITNAIPLKSGQSITSGVRQAPAYYAFTVPTNALSARFDLTDLSGNADLYVRFGEVPLPDIGRFDALTTNSGTTPESILIDSSSVPTPLTAGTWYVAVVSREVTPVVYTIAATYDTGGFNFTDLTDSIPIDSTLSVDVTNRLYRFIAPANTSALIFELYNLTGEAHLFASIDVPPAVSPSVISNLSVGGLPEVIVLRTNLDTNDLVGTYFLEVRSGSTTNLQYRIRAATRQNGLLLSGQSTLGQLGDFDSSGMPTSVSIGTIPGELYELQYSMALTADTGSMIWVAVPPPIQAGGTLLKFTLPTPAAGTGTLFYRTIQLPQ